MTYIGFRNAVRAELRGTPSGLTWSELRDRLVLPHDRACPAWTKRPEQDIGLTRTKGSGRALVWKLRETCVRRAAVAGRRLGGTDDRQPGFLKSFDR